MLALERKVVLVWCEKARKHICVTDRHDMTLADKVALNTHTTKQMTNNKSLQPRSAVHFLQAHSSLNVLHDSKYNYVFKKLTERLLVVFGFNATFNS